MPGAAFGAWRPAMLVAAGAPLGVGIVSGEKSAWSNGIVDFEIEERFDQIGKALSTIVQTQEVMSRNLLSLAAVLEGHTKESDVRMTRIEHNLDLLIRAIPAEHTNGKN
jgi:hypothetical protein